MIELIGLVLAVAGLILAFETPRTWVVQNLKNWGILKMASEDPNPRPRAESLSIEEVPTSEILSPEQPPSPSYPEVSPSEAVTAKALADQTVAPEMRSTDSTRPKTAALEGSPQGGGTYNAPAPHEYMPSLTVEEIIEAVNTAPLFQRESIAAHYKGIPVQWEGFLRRVAPSPVRQGEVMVNLITRKFDLSACYIWFHEHPDKIPEIRTLHADSKIRISGTIESVSGDGLCVTVTPTTINILERAPRATSGGHQANS